MGSINDKGKSTAPLEFVCSFLFLCCSLLKGMRPDCIVPPGDHDSVAIGTQVHASCTKWRHNLSHHACLCKKRFSPESYPCIPFFMGITLFTRFTHNCRRTGNKRVSHGKDLATACRKFPRTEGSVMHDLMLLLQEVLCVLPVMMGISP